MEGGAASVWIGYYTTLDIPSETTQEGDRMIYTEYSPLGICGGEWHYDTCL